MQEKLKQLELLISQLLSRQKETQKENLSLKNRLRVLEEQVGKLKGSEADLRVLKEWKKNAQTVMRRLVNKVDKEIEKAQQANKKII